LIYTISQVQSNN